MESAKSKKDKSKSPEGPRDPFAVDFFGAESSQAIPPLTILKSVAASPLPEGVSRDWAESIESIESVDDNAKPGLPRYPSWLEHIVTNHLIPEITAFDLSDQDVGHFEVLSYGQIEPADTSRFAAGSRDVAVTIEAMGQRAILVFSGEFGSEIIDRVLGAATPREKAMNPLSEIELAICEFVVASALSHVNDSVGKRPGFRLKGISNVSQMDWDLGADLVEIVGDVVIGELSGMTSLVMPFGMVEALNDHFDMNGNSPQSENLIRKFRDKLSGFRMNLVVGKTSVPAIEIPFLENGDVILVAEPVQEWWAGLFRCGEMKCVLGNSANSYFNGRFVGKNGFEIGSFVSVPARADFQRFQRDDSKFVDGIVNAQNTWPGTGEKTMKESEAASGMAEEAEAGLVSLENVIVDLRVQVAGRRINLEELGSLRAGQIIDLGCRPDDPVELFADNNDRPIAAGELVKIEDRLGVRIVKLFV